MPKTIERRTATYHAGTDREIVIDFTPGNHRYRVNGQYMPSVTTMLNLLAIDALPWWGMKVGVQGAVELETRLPGATRVLTADEIITELVKRKLDVNRVREAAADRGNLPHEQLAVYATTGQSPTLDEVPADRHGFTMALAAFLLDARPEFVDSELLVASVEYGYTGTLDARVIMPDTTYLVTDWWIDEDGEFQEERGEFSPALRMIDAKTSETPRTKPGRGVYTQHHLQLALYENAAIECGKEPTDEQLVVNLHESGRYKVARNVATIDDAAPFIPLYHAVKRVEKSMREAGKAVAA